MHYLNRIDISMSIFVPILALFSNSWIFNGFMSVIFYVTGKVLNQRQNSLILDVSIFDADAVEPNYIR